MTRRRVWLSLRPSFFCYAAHALPHPGTYASHGWHS